MNRIVIVGAGVAGLRAAERLRELDYDNEIVIVGDEARWPYHRPLVSKDLLCGSDRPSDLTLQRHVETGARWRLGTRAERLDTQRKVVTLPGDEEIKYDGLIIATGVEPRHMKGVPRHSPRVHTLRTVDEAMALKRTISESDLPIVVLGTGYIGCDVAASARKMGRDVTMVGRSRFPLKALGNDVASAVDNLHRKHRVRMAMGTDIQNWVTADDSITMHTTDGQLLVAGAVVMAIGSIPAVEWMRGSGLVLEDGVLCDSALFAAGAEDVVVAGDCGRWPNLRFSETPRRVEHWINAVEMGRHAAENLLVGREKATPFMPIPRVWSGQYGMRLQIAGVPALGTDTVHLSDGAPGTPGVTGYVRNGKLVGVCGWDTPRAMIKWTEELHRLLPVPDEPRKRPVAPAPAKAVPATARPPMPPAREQVPTAPVPAMAPAMASAGVPAMASAEMTMVQTPIRPQALAGPRPGSAMLPAMASASLPAPTGPSGSSARMMPVPRPTMSAAGMPPVARPTASATGMPPVGRPTSTSAGMPPVGRPTSTSGGMPPAARPTSTSAGMAPVGRPTSTSAGMEPVARPMSSGSMPRPTMSSSGMPPVARPPAPAGPPRGRGPVPPRGPAVPTAPAGDGGGRHAKPVHPSMPMARPQMHPSMPMSRPNLVEMTTPVPPVRESSYPETASIPNLSAPNLSLSNLAVPKIPVPDTPAAAMRPAPPPARQRRSNAEASQALPPLPPPLPGQHPSFPNMRPVARPDMRPVDHPSFENLPPVPPPTGRYQEHPSFPNMRSVPPPSGRFQEHPSFPTMQPVGRPNRDNVRFAAGEVIRGFG